MAHRSTPIFTPQTPGEVLRDRVIKRHRITQDQLALALGVSRLTVNQLVNNKRAVTAEMALRLARVLGTSPEAWLNMQRRVDLEEARRKRGAEIDRLSVLCEIS